MGLYEIGDKVPHVPADVYLAPGCQVVGDVSIGSGSSVWFNAVIRGDVNGVTIGAASNIQDLCMVRAAGAPCQIGDEVTIGQGAVLHGCQVADRVLIGSGAVLLDGVEVGEEAIIAAHAMVRVGFKVPPGTLVAGVPAEVKRELSAKERGAIRQAAHSYVERAERYREGLRAAQYRPPPEDEELDAAEG
ncbi:MAG TPA: gamma carbonic anhydrase family protein [Planctomycetes bacterium]|nr:gamma carbonic anhydrase family protein [Planctomycetota bacterium]